MKTFYLCTKADFVGHHHQFQNSHYIDLDDGKILLCAEFRNEEFEGRWLKQPHILELPHALSGEVLTQAHVDQLAEHIPGVSVSDNAWTLAKKVAKIHPLMSLK
jgi:hypothetical protein